MVFNCDFMVRFLGIFELGLNKKLFLVIILFRNIGILIFLGYSEYLRFVIICLLYLVRILSILYYDFLIFNVFVLV